MNRHLVLGASLVAGAAMLLYAAPAIAHGSVQWSVTVGTPQYYSPPPAVVYAPPPVVVYSQPQFIYGAPPSVYAPPAGTYIQPPQVYQQTWQVEQYRQPYAYHDRSWRERDDRHERYEQHEWREQRREWRGSGDQRDGRHWGNREQRR
jgi:hypothetical protein